MRPVAVERPRTGGKDDAMTRFSLLFAALIAGSMFFGMGQDAMAQEQAAPMCAPETWGQLACIGGVSCECRNKQASAMTGDPGGFRWDCGINRPRCRGGANADVPATLNPYTGNLPNSVIIEGDTTITNRNSNTNTNTND